MGTLPLPAGLGKLGVARWIFVVAFDLWDHLGRRVCHCHCGSDRSSRHPVRLVWVNGSFGCRTIAARTRDLILDTILAVTNSYSIIPVLPWHRDGQPNPQIGLK